MAVPAPGAVQVSVLGVPVRIDGDPAVVSEVVTLLADVSGHPPATQPAEVSVAVRRSGRRYVVETGSALSEVDDSAAAVAQVLAAVNTAVLTGPACFATHAGVVARHGRAVAFPAASGAGKSTLVAACLRAGWEYVSDEALCLDWSTGALLSYPRPMELSAWSRAVVGLPAGQESPFVTAGRLGAPVAMRPLALDHVVLLERDTRLALDPLPRRLGVAALLTRSFNHWRDPGRAFDLAHQVVTQARVWRLRLGDPHAAADLLTRRLPGAPRIGDAGQPCCRETSDR